MRSVNEIKSEAWNILTERKWFGPIIVSVFNVFLTFMLSFLSMSMGTNNIYITFLIELMIYVCITVPFSMGISIYMLKFVRGEEVSVGNVFDGFLYAVKMFPIAVIMLVLSTASNYILGLSLSNPGNITYSVLGVVIGLISAVIGMIIKMSYFLIYDNNGKVFSSLKAMTHYMLTGGIGKYILLMLSFIFWIIGVAFSFGMLAFLVLPYMETASTIFYEEIKL